MHGRIECPDCRTIVKSCRCFFHSAVIAYEKCSNCKESAPDQAADPLFSMTPQESHQTPSGFVQSWLISPKDKK